MSMKMTSHHRSFSVSERGNAVEENEDRYSRRGKKNVLLAVSDGATEASFSGEWADFLVQSPWKNWLLGRAYIEETTVPEELVRDWLEPIRRDFEASLNQERLPWYLAAKVRQGAFATFLGFRMSPRGRWIAVSCGDSCIVRVRGGCIIDSFPFKNSSEFGDQPRLVSSKPGASLPEMAIASGETCADGEVIILATDALAAWMLEDGTRDKRARRLLSCQSQDEFAALIAEESQEGRLKNDDATAVIHHVRL